MPDFGSPIPISSGNYAETLDCWLATFGRKRQQVRDLGFDDGFIRLWRFYLTSCSGAFRSGRTDVMQVGCAMLDRRILPVMLVVLCILPGPAIAVRNVDSCTVHRKSAEGEEAVLKYLFSDVYRVELFATPAGYVPMPLLH